MEPNRPFTITARGKDLEIIPKKIGGDWVYIVRFPDHTPTLMLTLATLEKGGHFWTSIPEGRQREAEMIGPAIAAHYASSLAC